MSNHKSIRTITLSDGLVMFIVYSAVGFHVVDKRDFPFHNEANLLPSAPSKRFPPERGHAHVAIWWRTSFGC